MNWRRIGKVYGIMVVVISLSLYFVPLGAQALNKPYELSSSEILVFDITTRDRTWDRSGVLTISCDLPPLSIGASYVTRFSFHFNLKDSNDRYVVMTFKAYANSEQIGEGGHTFDRARAEGGNIFTYEIPRNMVNQGNIVIRVDVSLRGEAPQELSVEDRELFEFYDFVVGNDGRYSAGKWVDGERVVLLEGFLDAIGHPGDINRIHIEANGPNMRFFINDQFLGNISDVEHDSGDIALTAQKPEGTQFFEASFDNVIIARHP